MSSAAAVMTSSDAAPLNWGFREERWMRRAVRVLEETQEGESMHEERQEGS